LADLKRRKLLAGLSGGGDAEKRAMSAVEFVRACRTSVYDDLRGPTPGPERQRERAYLRALAQDAALVQAFFASYRRLIFPFNLSHHWGAFSSLLSVRQDETGVVTHAERAEEPGIVDFPAQTPREGDEFSWGMYYGGFSAFAELMLFKQLLGLDSAVLHEAFVECAAREEVNDFLDILIRIRLIEALSPLVQHTKIKDAAETDYFLRKLFVIERDHVEPIVSRLGKDERIAFANVGLFSPRSRRSSGLLRVSLRVIGKIERLSRRWCAKRSGPGTAPAIVSRLRGSFREALQLGVRLRGRVGSITGKGGNPIALALLEREYAPRLKKLRWSIARRQKQLHQSVQQAVRGAFRGYLKSYRYGRTPLDAYIHLGFREGGFIYLRAMRALQRIETKRIQQQFIARRQSLLAVMESSSGILRRRINALSPIERWVLRYKMAGMTNTAVAARLLKKFPDLDNKEVSRLWSGLRLLFGNRWRVLESAESRAIEALHKKLGPS